MTDEQELAVCRYLDRLDAIGVPAKRSMISTCANSILAQSHTDLTIPFQPVGQHWGQRFLRAHLEYRVQKQKTLDVKRKSAEDPEAVKNWFKEFKKVIDDHGIQVNDIWNCDETGFRIGVGRGQWIVTREFNRQTFYTVSDNRETVTIMEAISGGGLVIPPMIIVAATRFMARWFDDLPDGYCLAYSDEGYINDVLSLEWLRHFDRYSSRSQTGSQRLLLLDGCISHCTYEFIQYYDQHRIIPFCFPPHMTYRMQPLDVVVFQPYKHYHAEAIDMATRTGCSDFNKLEFFATINSIRQQTFKKTIVLSAFHRTGLIPYDPNMVLKDLRPVNSVRMVTPTSDEDFENLPALTTPHTVRTLQRHSDYLRDARLSSLSFRENLESYIRGSLIQAHAGAQADDELRYTQMAENARATRQHRNRRAIKQGGLMYAETARHIASQRAIDELADVQRKAHRLEERA